MGFFDRGRSGGSTAKPSRTAPGGSSGREYVNRDGPGNSTVDYGKRPETNLRDVRARNMEKYGKSPWFNNRGQPITMGPNGPMITPDAGDPRNAGFFVDHATPFFDAEHEGDVARRRDLLAGDEGYQQAGSLREKIAAILALRQKMQEQRFVDQGGTSETWRDRFNPANEWPVPKSPLGVKSHGPGRPDFPTDRGTTGNPMMEGWSPGPSGGASTGASEANPTSDVLAALSRVQSMPIGAPTAATGALGGFAKAASATPPKKPTVVRRGGGVVTRA